MLVVVVVVLAGEGEGLGVRGGCGFHQHLSLAQVSGSVIPAPVVGFIEITERSGLRGAVCVVFWLVWYSAAA